MNIEEIRRTWELPNYFVVLPAYGCIYHEIPYGYPKVLAKEVSNPYNSGNEVPMTTDHLTNFLKKSGLLYENAIAEHPSERYWP